MLKDLFRSIFDFFANIFNFIISILIKVPIIGPIIIYLKAHQILLYIVVGSLLDNIPLIFLAGKLCSNLTELFLYGLLSIFVSVSIDVSFIIMAKYFARKLTISKNKFIVLLSSYGKYLLLFYRYIPFVRIPLLSVLSMSNDFKTLFIYNVFGAIIWSSSILFVGYLFH